MRASSSGRAERLGDEIVRAGVQRVHFVRLGVAHRQHDDGHWVSARIARQAASPPMPGMLISSRTRSGPELAHLLERLLAGLGVVHFVPGAGQCGAHDAPDLRLVVHHQNAARAHFSSPSAFLRQRHAKRGLARTAGHRQLSAVRPRDPVRDAQAQAGAGNLLLHGGAPVEPLEDAGLLRGGMPAPRSVTSMAIEPSLRPTRIATGALRPASTSARCREAAGWPAAPAGDRRRSGAAPVLAGYLHRPVRDLGLHRRHRLAARARPASDISRLRSIWALSRRAISTASSISSFRRSASSSAIVSKLAAALARSGRDWPAARWWPP